MQTSTEAQIHMNQPRYRLPNHQFVGEAPFDLMRPLQLTVRGLAGEGDVIFGQLLFVIQGTVTFTRLVPFQIEWKAGEQVESGGEIPTEGYISLDPADLGAGNFQLISVSATVKDDAQMSCLWLSRDSDGLLGFEIPSEGLGWATPDPKRAQTGPQFQDETAIGRFYFLQSVE